MAHFAQSPSFILHQVTCQFATGDTLFRAVNLTLDALPVCAGWPQRQRKNASAASAGGVDEPASGHIERFNTHAWVAQQQDISPQTTLAELLGYDAIFAARSAHRQRRLPA